MFPIIWRSLIGQYLKVLFLSLGIFVALLLTLRLNEIAHFAAMGPNSFIILKFIALQIPYMLPIAVAVGSLIASASLLFKLSEAHEITALRSSGFSLSRILFPILLTAGFISVGNFWIVSEFATKSHHSAAKIKNEIRTVNPLLLLNHKHLADLKGFYFETFGTAKMGETAEKAFIAHNDKRSGRMALFFAESLKIKENSLTGNAVSFLLPLKDKGKNEASFILENADHYTVPKDAFSAILGRDLAITANDHLKLPLLLSKLHIEKRKISQGLPDSKELKKTENKCKSEIARRISVGLSPFALTLLGATFGISVGRVRSYKSFFLMIFLTALFLVGYFVAKGLDHNFNLSLILYFVPESLMILASLLMIVKIERGVS